MLLMSYDVVNGFLLFEDSSTYLFAMNRTLSDNKAIIAEEPKALEYHIEKMNQIVDCDKVCFFMYDEDQFGEEVYQNIFKKYCKTSDFIEKLIKDIQC